MAEGENPEETGQDKQKPSIKVTDRRHFTLDGQRRTEVDDEPEIAPPPAAPASPGALPAYGLSVEGTDAESRGAQPTSPSSSTARWMSPKGWTSRC